MTTFTAHNQSELDEILSNTDFSCDDFDIIIDSSAGEWVEINDSRQLHIRAFNSSTVYAFGPSTVTAYDSSTVHAYDSSAVTAYDSSAVTACGSSAVAAFGSSAVHAYNSSTVHACDSSAVAAYDLSTVTAYDPHATITGAVRGAGALTITPTLERTNR